VASLSMTTSASPLLWDIRYLPAGIVVSFCNMTSNNFAGCPGLVGNRLLIYSVSRTILGDVTYLNNDVGGNIDIISFCSILCNVD